MKASPSNPGKSNCSETIQLECHAGIKRLGKQTRLVIAGDTKEPKHEDALINAIVRAQRWFGMLKRREVQSIARIAKPEGLQPTHLSSLMPLAFLAAGIVEAVPQGRQPEDVTVDRIVKLRPLNRPSCPERKSETGAEKI